MSEAFLKIVNMSISASWLVLVVLALRFLMKKAPKWVNVLLWGLVAIRLICPFSIERAMSLIPSAEVFSPTVLIETPEINTGIPVINNAVNPIIQDAVITLAPEKSVNAMKFLIQLFSQIWAVGVVLLLAIHWFNPLMWVAYILLCRDIELACDEKVINELANEHRADYTQALVHCSVKRRMIAACPLAFGEVGVKERVRLIMNYRKPTYSEPKQ